MLGSIHVEMRKSRLAAEQRQSCEASWICNNNNNFLAPIFLDVEIWFLEFTWLKGRTQRAGASQRMRAPYVHTCAIYRAEKCTGFSLLQTGGEVSVVRGHWVNSPVAEYSWGHLEPEGY